MSHGSEEGDNYWPGYVDALTSMVQVLAFVMMMLAMAVFVLSQSVSKKAVEAIAKAVNADVKPGADVKQLTQAVVAQIDRLQKSAPSSEAEPSQAAKSLPTSEGALRADNDRPTTLRISGAQAQPAPVPVEVPADAPRLTVGFADRSFKIAADQAQAIAGFVGEQGAAGQHMIVVNAFAYSGEGAVSEARRLAYYRGMMARKQLVDARVKPENIRINVNDTTDKSKGLTVELIVAGSAR
ncbi:conserved hypothetical protein [Bradyrhizobium oligotrophicum S58]|uniref:OmpA-like domain-containing protein n=1 Tax=Bradyrhizobium oligotrophicum S58 TaxID=1245469 RepID=M4Z3M0_9BRAD|nr:hypothetical protein [Bradyrhizobium oligotrophicum]BAM87447.1 conserved hypothetical protein [Bradyrhizobium oligotrophicum S58]